MNGGGVGSRGRTGERGFLCRRSSEEATHSACLTRSPPGTMWTDPCLALPHRVWVAGPQVTRTNTGVHKLDLCFLCNAPGHLHPPCHPRMLASSPRPPWLYSGSEVPAAETRQISSQGYSSSKVLTSHLVAPFPSQGSSFLGPCGSMVWMNTPSPAAQNQGWDPSDLPLSLCLGGWSSCCFPLPV